MHISLEEAIAFFNSWKTAATTLKVYSSSTGQTRELQAKVSSVKGAAIVLNNGENEIEVNLADADFNGDRWSFYSPLPAQQEAPNPDRRTPGYTPFPLNVKKPGE